MKEISSNSSFIIDEQLETYGDVDYFFESEEPMEFFHDPESEGIWLHLHFETFDWKQRLQVIWAALLGKEIKLDMERSFRSIDKDE